MATSAPRSKPRAPAGRRLVAGPSAPTSPFEAFTDLQRRRGRAPLGIQSLEIGIRVLGCIARHGGAMRLRDVATGVGMSPSKTHRYLVSLGRGGLVTQDADGGGYRLGAYALELGVLALGAVQPVKLAAGMLERLAARLRHTVAVSVWGSEGPTIVLLEESMEVVSMNIRPGTVTSLLGSASGQVFAAHLPSEQVASRIAAELAENRRRRRGVMSGVAAARLLERVRDRGLAGVNGTLVPGVAAIAAPVFDHRGRIVLALLAVSREHGLDIDPGSPESSVLREEAAALSRRLGHGVTPAAGAAAA